MTNLVKTNLQEVIPQLYVSNNINVRYMCWVACVGSDVYCGLLDWLT